MANEKEIQFGIRFRGSAETAKAIGSINRELDELLKRQKTLKKEIEQGPENLGTEQYEKLTEELGRVQASITNVRAAKRDLLYDQRKETEAANAAAGSYEKLAAQTALLEKSLKRLNPESAGFEELSALVEQNRLKLKDFDRGIESTRNLVGDYENSIIRAFGRLGVLDLHKNKIEQLELSEKELLAEVKQLGDEYRRLKNAGGEAFETVKNKLNDASVSLEGIERELSATRGQLQGLETVGVQVGDALSKKFNEVFGVLAAGYGIIEVKNKVQEIIRDNADLSDSIGDVRKTTGETIAELDDLYSQLEKRNTRTTLIGQIDIAKVAGQLGVAKNEILDFTDVVDKSIVALGDELGQDVDKVSSDLGKIAQVYRTDGAGIADGINRIGSAVNELSAAGTATAGFAVDFTKRLGGVAPLANISAANILGLGAAVEELGQTEEVASSAISKFLVKLGSDAPKFAKIAGIEIKAFNKLVKEDANEAFLRVLEGAKKYEGGLSELSDTLDALGVKEVRSTAVLGALINNTDKVRERQALANKSFSEGTSLVNEFTIKNTTLGAEIAKLNNTFKNYILFNPSTNESLAGIVRGISEFTVYMVEHKALLSTLVTVTTALIASRFTYTSAIRASTVAQWLDNASKSAGMSVTIAYAAAERAYTIVKAALTGQITLATAAQRLFNLAMASNPIVAAIAIIGTLTTAYFAFSSSAKEVVKQVSDLDKVQATYTDRIAKERAELQVLLNFARDERNAKSLRLDAMKKINAISPEYLGNLTLETINTKEATEAINNYILALEKKAKQAAFEEKINEIIKEQTDLQISLNKAKEKENELILEGRNLSRAGDSEINQFNLRTTRQGIAILEAQIKKTEERLNELRSQAGLILTGTPAPTGGTPPADPTKQKRLVDFTEEQLRFSNAMAELALRRSKEQLAILSDSLNKELAEARQGYDKQLLDAKEFTEKQIQLAKDRITAINKADNLNPKQKAELVKEANDLIEAYTVENQNIVTAIETGFNEDRLKQLVEHNTLAEALYQGHGKKTNEIIKKWHDKDFQDAKDALDKQIAQIKLTYEEKLAIISTQENEGLRKLNESYLAGTISYKKYKDEIEKIQAASNKERLRKEIEQMQREIQALEGQFYPQSASTEGADVTNGPDQEIITKRAQMYAELARLQREYSDFVRTDEQTLHQERLAAVGQALEYTSQAVQQFESIVTQIYAKQVAEIDALISKKQEQIADLESKETKATGTLKAQLKARLEAEKQQEKELADERKRIRKQEAAARKTFALIQAIINTAMGVTRALADYDYAGAIAIGIAGAIQIGIIGASNYEEAAKGAIMRRKKKARGKMQGGGEMRVESGGTIPHEGGMIQGNLHSSGGVKFIDNITGKAWEAEGGELFIRNGDERYIINRRSSADPHLRALASAINVAGGGRSFAAQGASLGGFNKLQAGGIIGAALNAPDLRGMVNKGEDMGKFLERSEQLFNAINSRIDRMQVVFSTDKYDEVTETENYIKQVASL